MKNIFACALLALVFLASGCEMTPVDLRDPGADAGSTDAGAAQWCPDGWENFDGKKDLFCWKKFKKGDLCPKGYENALDHELDAYGNLVCVMEGLMGSEDAGSADAGKTDTDKVEDCEDCDGDGATKQIDCDDTNANIYPGATEKCNKLDDNCDGVVDEGCSTGKKPVDSDGDGYTSGPKDCDDSNANIHPGAIEVCGDNVDNNCDGVVDEGCNTQPSDGNVTVTVKYPDSDTRVLNVQLFNNVSQLGSHWGKHASSDGQNVSLSLSGVNLNTSCGVRLNVSEGNPAYSWLCQGNGSTANLDSDAQIHIKWGNANYDEDDLITWSAPGGTNQGCSAVLAVNCSF
jgi:hypothetical protein